MASLLAEQALNGLQFGVMLFLMGAGLTLIFGIMNVVNLAHGSLYMAGAYLFTWCYAQTGSLIAGLATALGGALALGVLLEVSVFRQLYRRDPVHQVLATFALTLVFNDLARGIWGPSGLYSPVPPLLAGTVQLWPGLDYPLIRLATIGVGIAVAAGLYGLVSHTKLGMLIRAGASNRVMVGALGVDIALLYTLVFAIGAALAALSGLLAGPIYTVQPGMGDDVLILAFVVIVIGGVGSIRGALVASILVGLVDTTGRAFLRPLLGLVLPRGAADSAGPGVASVMIYLLMVVVLFVRPRGLFPQKTR